MLELLAPQTIKVITPALGCMPEPDAEILLLKMPQALVTGHGERKTGTDLETPSWLLFTVPERLSLQAAGGGLLPIAPLGCGP